MATDTTRNKKYRACLDMIMGKQTPQVWYKIPFQKILGKNIQHKAITPWIMKCKSINF